MVEGFLRDLLHYLWDDLVLTYGIVPLDDLPSGTAASGLLRKLEQIEGTERHLAEANRREERVFKEHSHSLKIIIRQKTFL